MSIFLICSRAVSVNRRPADSQDGDCLPLERRQPRIGNGIAVERQGIEFVIALQMPDRFVADPFAAKCQITQIGKARKFGNPAPVTRSPRSLKVASRGNLRSVAMPASVS